MYPSKISYKLCTAMPKSLVKMRVLIFFVQAESKKRTVHHDLGMRWSERTECIFLLAHSVAPKAPTFSALTGKCLPIAYARSEGQTIQSGRRESSTIHPELRAWIITASPSSEASHGNHEASCAAAFALQSLIDWPG